MQETDWKVVSETVMGCFLGRKVDEAKPDTAG